MGALAPVAPGPERDTARAMSQENVELMRRVLEAFNSGDPDAVAEFAHPEGADGGEQLRFSRA
jgi:hypothetical protein